MCQRTKRKVKSDAKVLFAAETVKLKVNTLTWGTLASRWSVRKLKLLLLLLETFFSIKRRASAHLCSSVTFVRECTCVCSDYNYTPYFPTYYHHFLNTHTHSHSVQYVYVLAKLLRCTYTYEFWSAANYSCTQFWTSSTCFSALLTVVLKLLNYRR